MGKRNYNFKTLLDLFFSFFKIGLFTFGGGYAMIPLIDKQVVENKKWISEEEMVDIITISESTPGPIAVNASTFVGYKVAGVIGALFATIGLVVPSFVIILIVSFFYKEFSSNLIVKSAFKGLKIGVCILLFRACLKLKKNVRFTFKNIALFIIGLVIMLLSSVLSWKIVIGSFKISISLLLIILGLLVGILSAKTNKESKK